MSVFIEAKAVSKAASEFTKSSRRLLLTPGLKPLIELYTTSGCEECVVARKVLTHKSLSFVEHDTSRNYRRLQLMREKAPSQIFPQIVINHQWIGGFDDLLNVDLTAEPNFI